MHLKGAKRDVLRVSQAATSAVGWEAGVDASPRLDPCAPDRVMQDYVLCGDVLDHFDLARILADAAHCERETIVESAIGDVNIGRVLLHADGIIPVVDDPAQESDAVCVHGLRRQSVGVMRSDVLVGTYIYTIRIDNASEVTARSS